MIKLLLIDDDSEVLILNKTFFQKEGYDVKAAISAVNGIKLLKNFKADCIVMDIMMPELDGFEACKIIRTITNSPIIFLTGRSSEDDKINGLLIGADDYIVKPYSLRELSARIKVQIRRHGSTGNFASSTTLNYPPLKLDLAAHKAFYNDEEILLSNREYELLYLLISKPNQTITFEDIAITMWGIYSDADRRTIMVTASRLRKKFENYIGLTELIETVWSKGYKFNFKE